MSFTDLLIHTCTVRRNTPGVVSNYGTKDASWADHLTTQACRLVADKGREIRIGLEVFVADYKLFIADVDVTEQDRILLDSVTYEILAVELMDNGFGGHHKELALLTVR